MKSGRFCPGQAYVAVKTLNGLHILNFNPKAIKASQDIKAEMNRLNSSLLSFLPMTSEYCGIKIALLNTRSIVSKLPDIEQDSNLASASVACFTETWLKHDQNSPHLADHHAAIRSDRDCESGKGGVMISVHKTLQMSRSISLSFSHVLIEAATTILTLPGHEQLQVTVVYRSPSVPTNTLLTTMSSILSQTTTANMPSIILGDFNDDLLVNSNLRLVELMSSYDFSQLVGSPTTNNGTLIDHVYYNRPHNSCQVKVIDAYYSDHDIIMVHL